MLAVAFLIAKTIFNREVQKLKSNRYLRTPVFRDPQSSGLAAKPPKPSEPLLVETIEFDLDWYFGPECAGKTSGEIFGIMFAQTLVDGKQTWEVLKDNPENKHDLDLMLACCKAEMEASQIALMFPAPAYFKRVAIILRKQKDYVRELGIIELYWQLCDRVLEEATRKKGRIQAERMEVQHSALKAGFQDRYDKAKFFLEKQKKKAQK